MDKTISVIVTDAEDSYIPVADSKVVMDRDAFSIESLMELGDIVDAYLKSWERSGKTRDEVAADMGVSTGYLNRVLNRNTTGSERRFIQGESLIRFMLSCGNSIALQWLIYRFSFFTGFVTLPGNKKIEMRVIDGIPSYGAEYSAVDELRDVKALLKELFEVRRQLRRMGESCSIVMTVWADKLFSEIAKADEIEPLL